MPSSTGDAAVAHKYGIGLGLKMVAEGFEVVSVCPNSYSEAADVKLGAILVSADGRRVSDGLQPLDILGPKGTAAALEFSDGTIKHVQRGGPPLDENGTRQDGVLGLSLSVIHQRVLVANVMAGSPAAREGLQMGDCITSVNGHSVDPVKLTKRGPVGQRVTVQVTRQGYKMPKAIHLHRLAMGSGWKAPPSKSTDKDEEPNPKKFMTHVVPRKRLDDEERTPRSPRPDRERSDRSSSRGSSQSRSKSKSAPVAQVDDALLTRIETLETQVCSLEYAKEQAAVSARAPIEGESEGVTDLKLQLNEALKKIDEMQKELATYKAKFESNTKVTEETASAIKMMNLGIHAAVNGISGELDTLFKHAGLKRAPRKEDKTPAPRAKAAPVKGKGSTLGAVTEEGALSPASMKLTATHPSAPGGLAVLGGTGSRADRLPASNGIGGARPSSAGAGRSKEI
mmetsp:Transcript_19011/g.44551  ORF Transcript_19011/g.44551 Transcript_19011/m.44551 type:complete len:454 (-) Transcript_19011:156-1517(-)